MLCLAKILAVITKQQRYFPEIKWSKTSWTHNIFRAYEYLFGRRYGIRAEMSSMPHISGETYYFCHSWESIFALTEAYIRDFLTSLKPKPFKVYIPLLANPIGLPIPASPYLFAIAVNVASQGSATSTTPGTWSHISTGSNLMLFISCAINNTTDSVTSVTYNSIAATNAAIVTTYTFGGGKSQIFYTLGPSTGSNTVSAAFSGGFFDGNACTYSGVAQTGQPDGTGTATTGAGTASTLSVNVTVTASNCWLIGAIANNGTATSAGAGTVLRQQGSNVLGALYDSGGTVGTGTQSLTVTIGSANAYCISAASFSPFASASPISSSFLLLGV